MSYADQLVAINPSTCIERRIPASTGLEPVLHPGRQACRGDGRATQPHRLQRSPEFSADGDGPGSRSCKGPNHADFSANGRFFLVTCEFSGSLLRVSTLGERVTDWLDLGAGEQAAGRPALPHGRSFYVADMGRNRLLRVGWDQLRVIGSTKTAMMPHGIYPSRDGRFLYVSASRRRLRGGLLAGPAPHGRSWTPPGGGTPDMGGLSADGHILWLSGRTSGYVDGMEHPQRSPGSQDLGGWEPAWPAVWPQPGREQSPRSVTPETARLAMGLCARPTARRSGCSADDLGLVVLWAARCRAGRTRASSSERLCCGTLPLRGAPPVFSGGGWSCAAPAAAATAQELESAYGGIRPSLLLRPGLPVRLDDKQMGPHGQPQRTTPSTGGSSRCA